MVTGAITVIRISISIGISSLAFKGGHGRSSFPAVQLVALGKDPMARIWVHTKGGPRLRLGADWCPEVICSRFPREMFKAKGWMEETAITTRTVFDSFLATRRGRPRTRHNSISPQRMSSSAMKRIF